MLKTILFLLSITILQIKPDTCSISDERCQSCLPSTPSKCSQCYESFWANSKCETIINPIAKCRTYSSLTTCKACHIGYFLQNNTCVRLKILNCLYAENINTCNACADSYLPAADNSLCTKTSCNIKNCNICVRANNEELCLICKNDFSTDDKYLSCNLNQDNNFNCLQVVGGKCISCQDGFFMDKDKCMESDFIPKLFDKGLKINTILFVSFLMLL